MASFKKVPVNKKEGKIVYGKDIVSDIVYLALKEIPNVELYSITPCIPATKSAISVAFEKEGVVVDVSVKTHFMQNVSETAFKIQEAVRHNVESMTEYHIASVNVAIKGVSFDDVRKEQVVPTEEKQ
jgi:uncharacterized alkaline shock family protein YloU